MLDWYSLLFSQSLLGTLGQAALFVALLFALVAFVQAILAARREDEAAASAAGRGILACFLFCSLSLLALMAGMIGDDFGMRYVAKHSMAESPLWIKITGLWGALEGSIMLWLWLLALYSAAAVLTTANNRLRPWVFAGLLFNLIFFLFVCLAVASPFAPLASVPSNGAGPNPALQNHWMMAVHPVLLYLGFVGLAVPFSHAVAALMVGQMSGAWVSAVRRWTLIAWAFLSLGIVSGGWWSYETLGWGGYWAWDPIENASFVPWLLTTAFLHSIQIQEKHGSLKTWNVWLIVLAYSSTVLGTFLNRSGIVQSVHAFAGGGVGEVFFGFLVLLLLLGTALASWRAGLLREFERELHPLSKEGSFLAGNWIFVVFAFMVLLGTLFPTILEAVQGHRDTSVGTPFYNAFAVPLSLGLMALMALGPVLPWGKADNVKLWPALRAIGGAGLAAGALALAFGVRETGPLLTVALAAANVAGVLWETALHRRQKKLPLGALLASHPRRYGAFVAHLGLVIIGLGVAFSSSYRQDTQATLQLNEPTTLLGQQLELTGTAQNQRSDGHSLAAMLRINGQPFVAKMNFYNQSGGMAFPAPAVQYHFFGDTYLVVTAFDEHRQWASVRLVSSPLVGWIWWGSLVMIIGTGVTLLPQRRNS